MRDTDHDCGYYTIPGGTCSYCGIPSLALVLIQLRRNWAWN